MRKEELLKFYDKFKLYIFPAVVALSSMVLIILIIYPQTAKLLSNQKKALEISQKAKFLEDKAEKLESYNADDLNFKVNYVLGAYPVDKDYVTALKILQNIVAQSGFSIVSLSLGSSGINNEQAQSFSLKLDVLGPSSQLPTFLGNIEGSYRLMRVSSMETSSGKDAVLTVALSIEVLYSAPPGGFGSVDSPLPQLSEEEEKILSKLATVGRAISQEQSASQLAPRGKPNPFE